MAIIRIKIDCKKIDKARLFAGKNGALYLDATLLENRDGVDQYGNDGMIVQDVKKEEREAGVKGAILGNFRIMGTKQPEARPARREPSPPPADNSDAPF